MLIIKNALIYCSDEKKSVIQNGFLTVKDSIIDTISSGVPEEKQLDRANEIIDANGAILTPGFINSHTHIPMVLFRDLGENLPGKDLLFKLFFPIEKQFITEEFVFDASRLTCLELLSGGVTCFADMYYFEEQVAHAVQNTGMRAVLGETIANFATPDAHKAYGGLDCARKFIEQFKTDSLITPSYAPHAPYSVHREILEEINRCAEEDGVPVLIHLAELKNEAELMWQNLQENPQRQSPVIYLSEQQLLSPNWLAAHCIQLNNSEQEILRKSGVRVSHNPLSNLKGEQGIASASEMNRLGIPIGLGTDSALGGNSQNLFQVMSYAYYLQRSRLEDYRAVSAADVLYWATLGGAKALGLDKNIGSLEVGKQADMVLWKKDSFALYQALDLAAALVLASGPQDIDSVWVAGKQKLNQGKLLHSEKTDIFDKAQIWRSKVYNFCVQNQIL